MALFGSFFLGSGSSAKEGHGKTRRGLGALCDTFPPQRAKGYPSPLH